MKNYVKSLGELHRCTLTFCDHSYNARSAHSRDEQAGSPFYLASSRDEHFLYTTRRLVKEETVHANPHHIPSPYEPHEGHHAVLGVSRQARRVFRPLERDAPSASRAGKSPKAAASAMKRSCGSSAKGTEYECCLVSFPVVLNVA